MKIISIFSKHLKILSNSFVNFRLKMLPIRISVFIGGSGGGAPEAIGSIENIFEKSMERWNFLEHFQKSCDIILISRSQFKKDKCKIHSLMQILRKSKGN